MRHRKSGRKFGRKSAPRRALRRDVVNALFEHGRIVTTLPRAKEFRPWAEKLITIARRVSAARAAEENGVALAGFRRLVAEMQDVALARKLVEEIAPRFADRPGGYTRIMRHAKGRLGDNAPTAVFELVEREAAVTSE